MTETKKKSNNSCSCYIYNDQITNAWCQTVVKKYLERTKIIQKITISEGLFLLSQPNSEFFHWLDLSAVVMLLSVNETCNMSENIRSQCFQSFVNSRRHWFEGLGKKIKQCCVWKEAIFTPDQSFVFVFCLCEMLKHLSFSFSEEQRLGW